MRVLFDLINPGYETVSLPWANLSSCSFWLFPESSVFWGSRSYTRQKLIWLGDVYFCSNTFIMPPSSQPNQTVPLLQGQRRCQVLQTTWVNSVDPNLTLHLFCLFISEWILHKNRQTSPNSCMIEDQSTHRGWKPPETWWKHEVIPQRRTVRASTELCPQWGVGGRVLSACPCVFLLHVPPAVRWSSMEQ